MLSGELGGGRGMSKGKNGHQVKGGNLHIVGRRSKLASQMSKEWYLKKKKEFHG